MSKVKKYEFHELANIFPIIEGEAFDRLVEDIEKNGLLEPIVLFEGKILDGRNRYLACVKLGRQPTFKRFPNKVNAFDYVIAENIRRRHLNEAQIAEIGVEMAERRKRRKEWEIAQKLYQEHKKELIDFRLMKKKKEKKIGRPPEPPKKKEMPKKIGTTITEISKELPITHPTIYKAKKIKDVAKKEPVIAKEWEKAKKGETGVNNVYQKAKIIEKLPEEVKEEVRKEKPKITFEQAKKIAELPKPEQRKEVLKKITQSQDKTEKIIDSMEKMAKLEDKLIISKENIDQKHLNVMNDIWLKISQEYRDENLKQYNKITQKESILIMEKARKFILDEVEKYRKRNPNP
ncbi:MAG: ParB N-terminal domain-containing protein [Candidatus Odinarchaeota archaeon]